MYVVLQLGYQALNSITLRISSSATYPVTRNNLTVLSLTGDIQWWLIVSRERDVFSAWYTGTIEQRMLVSSWAWRIFRLFIRVTIC